ncbi:MAG: chorismate mutase [Lachnospiraceae bacterium]|nr:chorismate mutase [Lachnospiraceae bacterium]
MNELDQLRQKIEAIDSQMVELFEDRMKCSFAIAKYKRERGLPVLDKEREKLLLDKNAKLVKDKVLEAYYREYLQDVMDISKKYQNRLMEGAKVAYSGIEGSFASISVSKIFPQANRIPCHTFQEAYDAVESGDADLCVLPIENSYAGEVGQVTDLMFSGDLYINGVYELRVSQCLLGVMGSDESTIKSVISHPQALEQCSDYISKHNYETVAFENTARAAREVANKGDVTVGAIASKETAGLYGLKVIDHDINESANNTTRFAVFAKSPDVVKQDDEVTTFILMFVVKDGAGTLAKAVSIIGEHGYSMKAIRSRPTKDKDKSWQYYFYTEVEGTIDSSDGQQMLDELKKECEFIKVIGSYKSQVRI